MNKPDTRAECCSDLENEAVCRNNYFDGKRLTTDSFRVEQRYLLERRHLLNRAIFGWGVVYGFAIADGGAPGRLKIGAGLALDSCGRELLQGAPRVVGIGDLIQLDPKAPQNKAGLVFTNGHPANEKICALLSVHYAEQSMGPVTVEDSCRCKHEEFERTCEIVRYSLQPIDCGDCCREHECKLTCKCATGWCCGEGDAHTTHKRGGCRCLCDYLTQLQLDESCSLHEVDDPCFRVYADLRHGVPLACVTLVRDAADRWVLGADVEPCGPRRLVKRNDLLFDLIQGCDLTRIEDFGWKDWHRRDMPFKTFLEALGTGGFSVKFSGPVRAATLQRDCFAIAVMSAEREGGWWQVFRAPIARIETAQADLVEEAKVVVDGDWLDDAVKSRKTIFDTESFVEIEVRGDFIVDCNGQAVDANGNGTPGGTFLSTFHLLPREKGA
jgi:hypothetical protein